MIVLIIVIITLIALVLYMYFHRGRRKITGYTPYVEALVALLENNKDLAMKKLKEAVNLDSDLVDAYVRLGDLYRKKGDVTRAIQIHQSLTVRPTLKKKEEKKVYYALVNDLIKTNRHNKAVSFLKEILKIDKKEKHAQELILRIYEDDGNYGDCITLYEESGFKPRNEKRHAFYYASYAHSKLKNLADSNSEIEKEAVNLLKKALKISPQSLTALYYLAKYYEQKGALEKAKEYYHTIITQHPDHAFLIVHEFEKVYFELHLFDDIIPIYENVFNKNPRNFVIGFALADLYEKKNEVTKARDVYNKLSDLYPKSILPKLRLLRLTIGEPSLIEKIAEIESAVKIKYFRCNMCNFEVKKLTLLCQNCHAIESLMPYS